MQIFINHQHLLIKVATPQMVSTVSRLLHHAVLDQAAPNLPEGHCLQELVYVYGPQQAKELGKLVIQKMDEAAKVMTVVADIKAGIAGIVQGQEELLKAKPPVAAAPEPISESEAYRLFALLRALELDTHFRKASVTRVFILYCLDGCSRDAVARACQCSAALISLRLKAIELRLGRKASELRLYSDHFERMADSLSDSRARHVRRENSTEAETDSEF